MNYENCGSSNLFPQKDGTAMGTVEPFLDCNGTGLIFIVIQADRATGSHERLTGTDEQAQAQAQLRLC